jgi:hypothetical protein
MSIVQNLGIAVLIDSISGFWMLFRPVQMSKKTTAQSWLEMV